jgi:CheY-like chemotaxis protein
MNPTTPIAPSPTAQASGSPAILNVNDDDANRYALTQTLKRTGYRVEEARTGAEALRLVAESRPDLVVLDVDLPDIDGFEVCRRIKADPHTAAIPVLHLSAHFVLEQDRVHGLVSGADGYLIQPVEPPELVASIRGLLRMSKAEDAARESARRVEQLEQELQELERLAASPPPPAGPGAHARPLREGHPGDFADLVARCGDLLDLALQQQKYRVENDVSAALRGLGDRLGALGAGPRDVIEVYGSALKARSAGAVAARARAYLNEGRLLVLELMGHLVAYYRDRAADVGRLAEP